MDTADIITNGSSILGFELGSTRIKAVLISSDSKTIASASHSWENRYENGIWTYHMKDVWDGVTSCFKDLKQNVYNSWGVKLKKIKAAGLSGMMHGYLALGKDSEPLIPFRTWRNTVTGEASQKLTKLLNHSIPERWTIAHLYQAILNNEYHLAHLDLVTSLAGYLHLKLTGKKVIGIGEASGMFVVDTQTGDYDQKSIDLIEELIIGKNYPWKLKDVFPKIITAGEPAGILSKEGSKLLDPSGDLEPGTLLCPPEGDAQTGMIATNTMKYGTGNVSAGTSVFSLVVLDKKPSQVYDELDLMLTPSGKYAALVQSNNCTSEINAWINLFEELVAVLGIQIKQSDLFEKLLPLALTGDADAGNMLSYGYLAGERITKFNKGCPLFVRKPDSNFNLANFLRSHLFTAFCSLRMGLDVLSEKESVEVTEIRGHGGFFKTVDVAQPVVAAALNTPVSLLETAGEGGAWGMALLAAFMIRNEKKESLENFLDSLLEDSVGEAYVPDPENVKGFNSYFARYKKGLKIEKAAVENM